MVKGMCCLKQFTVGYLGGLTGSPVWGGENVGSVTPTIHCARSTAEQIIKALERKGNERSTTPELG
jgi:hypothetical protein